MNTSQKDQLDPVSPPPVSSISPINSPLLSCWRVPYLSLWCMLSACFLRLSHLLRICFFQDTWVWTLWLWLNFYTEAPVCYLQPREKSTTVPTWKSLDDQVFLHSYCLEPNQAIPYTVILATPQLSKCLQSNFGFLTLYIYTLKTIEEKTWWDPNKPTRISFQ